MSLGITGNSPFASARSGDRLGLGYFRFSLASDIVEAIDPLLELNAEQGVEAFYTIELRPELAVTANVQWLDPARSDVGSSLLTGLRVRTRF
jgi:carbohydrate-selective porin OprB